MLTLTNTEDAQIEWIIFLHFNHYAKLYLNPNATYFSYLNSILHTKKKQWIRKYHHKTTKAPPAYLRLPIILPIVNYLSPSPPPPLTINIMISGNSKPKNSLNPSQSLLQCFTALIKLIPLSLSHREVFNPSSNPAWRPSVLSLSPRSIVTSHLFEINTQ